MTMRAEPMTADELSALATEFVTIERTQPPATAAEAIRLFAVASRLLATVRARNEQIARLKTLNDRLVDDALAAYAKTHPSLVIPIR